MALRFWFPMPSTAGQVILADASGIAAASGDLMMNDFDEGSFQGAPLHSLMIVLFYGN